MENHSPVLSVLYVCMVIIDRLLRSVTSAIQTSGEASSTFGRENANLFCVNRPYKGSISKEMNNDNV